MPESSSVKASATIRHALPNNAPSVIQRQNIYQEVIEQIKHYIVKNRLAPGDRLPTEAMFAEHFGVSRLTVREAIKVLESLGVIQSRTRDGMRLRALTFKPVANHLRFLLDMGDITTTEMADARQVLECAILPLVVRNATETDLDQLDAAVEEFARIILDSPSPEAIVEADMEFHLILLRATRNRALEGFGVMLQEFFQHLRSEKLARPALAKASLEDHRALAAALRERDAAAAEQILRRHLGVYETNLAFQKGESR